MKAENTSNAHDAAVEATFKLWTRIMEAKLCRKNTQNIRGYFVLQAKSLFRSAGQFKEKTEMRKILLDFIFRMFLSIS